MHSSIDVANRLLKLAALKKQTLTPMQLIKLVFLCHGWMLGLYGRHLINEPIEAWRYGPVIKSLYDEVKKYKSDAVENPIQSKIRNWHANQFDEIEENIIKQVYEKYGHFTGIELSSLTHANGSPWHVTWSKGGTNLTISNDLIENYYSTLAKNVSD
jgi:uncharacterized phage-associated protein